MRSPIAHVQGRGYRLGRSHQACIKGARGGATWFTVSPAWFRPIPGSSSSVRTMASSSKTMQPATPRPSASAIIINAQNEILFVHRNPQARAFGGVYVFPGGNFDPKQDDSLAMTAIRETFEESGLLLASSIGFSSPSLDATILDEARKNVHAQNLLFRDFLVRYDLVPDTGSLMPFTQWITPAFNPKRFHTQFLITFLPSVPSTGFSSGTHHHRLPTPDGGQEIIAARFLHPSSALSEFHSGKIVLMPPQFYLLTTLSSILQGRENTLEQRVRVRKLAEGAFGSMVINPRSLPNKDEEGRSILTYEGDETRGGSKGRLHRSLVRWGKGMVPTEIILQRNFNVFTEIETSAFQPGAKL